MVREGRVEGDALEHSIHECYTVSVEHDFSSFSFSWILLLRAEI
jgi:hypothetical protein